MESSGDDTIMKYRPLGRTGRMVSEISFGAWAIGGAWGHVSEKDALAALHRAVDSGVNFFDTADVYGDGRSERLMAELKKGRKEEIVVATKAGRRLPRQTIEGYSCENLSAWIERSLREPGGRDPRPASTPLPTHLGNTTGSARQRHHG
jgi:aryl-alcohol dehydrogenase-like predicted oxidoreductase